MRARLLLLTRFSAASAEQVTRLQGVTDRVLRALLENHRALGNAEIRSYRRHRPRLRPLRIRRAREPCQQELGISAAGAAPHLNAHRDPFPQVGTRNRTPEHHYNLLRRRRRTFRRGKEPLWHVWRGPSVPVYALVESVQLSPGPLHAGSRPIRGRRECKKGFREPLDGGRRDRGRVDRTLGRATVSLRLGEPRTGRRIEPHDWTTVRDARCRPPETWGAFKLVQFARERPKIDPRRSRSARQVDKSGIFEFELVASPREERQHRLRSFREREGGVVVERPRGTYDRETAIALRNAHRWRARERPICGHCCVFALSRGIIRPRSSAVPPLAPRLSLRQQTRRLAQKVFVLRSVIGAFGSRRGGEGAPEAVALQRVERAA
mmetsp:Transcript_7181/g.23832  ORF Transcript_7181/g.23832 Transcript_7181/m.23832 type:complete len:379 (+) Transcript_7181:3590-4726(+)